jgi:hypothetical protein
VKQAKSKEKAVETSILDLQCRSTLNKPLKSVLGQNRRYVAPWMNDCFLIHERTLRTTALNDSTWPNLADLEPRFGEVSSHAGMTTSGRLLPIRNLAPVSFFVPWNGNSVLFSDVQVLDADSQPVHNR